MSNETATAAAGWSARLKAVESSKAFQASVISIILLSAMMIGAKTYTLPPLMETALGVLDVAVTLFFLVEILLRFAACENKRRFFHDGWNVFDVLVVAGSLVPLENADAVLVGRLLRVLRVLRLVSVIPELRALIGALVRSIPQMSYIALLMFVIFYIYGAAGSLFFAKINPELWGDIAIAMLTLFRVATFEDWTDVMYEAMEVYPMSWLYFLSFIFLAAFIFLNMMVGTILEVMTAERDASTEEDARHGQEQLLEAIQQLQGQVDGLQAQLREQAPHLKPRDTN